MTNDENFGRASRLRCMAHEMLSMADELENKYTLRASKVVTYEYASLQALGARAAKEFTDRQRRLNTFARSLFGEPCWDMLLYLFVKKVEEQRARKSQVLIAAGVPTSTATRYFSVLQESGLVSSEPCTTDNRVQFVSLTTDGVMQMSHCMAADLRAANHGFDNLDNAIEGRRGKPHTSIELKN
ncbi:hypothetical protein [Aurantiacibacter rhizosphaerae]|uniref:MarR family transcriptional regulator n=1 Tax=Aurantiacibacter rhizosphaerae TaxID=2691582 RepID=A0A844XBJ1_9SPHN|nr:hypothetical protein [Aurantiacibacter rhizosphaerae]MWV27004.1 hypothetical protein [Aurantiacibacter rhizosphaerae]